ncbi:MAG: peptide chain release factor N(5)-glutamine methyltransferase [Candidatus Krumholzibacteria bacterium]|nr:peptide chain release factor N(5)-glutamine methyltransferase [Candidatus Krumholzibacteria bacterium]
MTSAAANKTVRELIRVTSEYFADKGVDSAKLNAERLLADVLGVSRIELFMQFDRPVLGDELDAYRGVVKRRAGGEPLQKILGETEFYSRTFKVAPGVFIPRPETEHLVEAAVALLTPGDTGLVAPMAVEIGCGTGVISVSLAAELPRLTVHATDINPLAVELAGRNAHTLGVEARVNIHLGSRFDPLPKQLAGQVDLLVSNPPYIRHEDIAGLPEDVKGHDPHTALDGGPDGLVFYRALAAKMGSWLRPGGHIAVEIGDDQGPDVKAILAASGGQDVQIIQDYTERDRVVTAQVG